MSHYVWGGPSLAAKRDKSKRVKEAFMGPDRVRGKTIRWIYDDGPMAGKSIEHLFGSDGTVSWRETDGEKKSAKPPANGAQKQKTGTPGTEAKAKYEVVAVNDDVCAVSYLAASGFTLTSVLDFAAGTVVSFASNEKELVPQRGTFEVAERVG
jgi:molybdenum cofactor biosynthesis MoaF-like protein